MVNYSRDQCECSEGEGGKGLCTYVLAPRETSQNKDCKQRTKFKPFPEWSLCVTDFSPTIHLWYRLITELTALISKYGFLSAQDKVILGYSVKTIQISKISICVLLNSSSKRGVMIENI